MKRILIVEDDPAILLGVTTILREEQFEVMTASDGEQGFQAAKKQQPDLLILDIMLPKKNGLDVCRDLRKDGCRFPILILTSKKGEVDEVLGFEIGANDYVTKPFSPQRLLARVRNLIRSAGETPQDIAAYSFGGIDIDFRKHEVIKKGMPVELSAKEFDILNFFIRHEGEVVSRELLLNEVWGYESYPTTRTVDNYILSLRKKLEDDAAQPRHFLTIHTVGYKFQKNP